MTASELNTASRRRTGSAHGGQPELIVQAILLIALVAKRQSRVAVERKRKLAELKQALSELSTVEAKRWSAAGGEASDCTAHSMQALDRLSTDDLDSILRGMGNVDQSIDANAGSDELIGDSIRLRTQILTQVRELRDLSPTGL